MYQKYIQEYQKKINQYSRTINKATAQNKKRLRTIAGIFAVLVPLSFLIPEPLFKLPLVWPIFGVSASGLLSAPFFNAYQQTKDIIDGAKRQISNLESDIELMKEYDMSIAKSTQKTGDKSKYSYDKTKQVNPEQVISHDQNGRGRR